MDGQFLIVIGSSIANFILAVLIVIHLRKSLSGRYLLWTIIGLTGWIIVNYHSNLNFSIMVLEWLNKAIFFFTSLFVWGLALFTKAFPEDKSTNKLFNIGMLAALFFVLVISLSSFLVKSVIPKDGIVDIEFGWGMVVYSVFVLGCLIYAAIKVLVKYFKEKRSEVKQALHLFILGIGIFLLLAITTNLILPIFGIFYLSILAPVYTAVFGFLIFLGMLKYHFLNIKVIASELITFSLWITLLIQLFFSNGLQERVVNGGVLILTVVFGIFLIKSVLNEVRRKEELQSMADALSKANDQLRKLDNAKTEFISIASHQLRTPLTAIKGFLSLVLEGSYGEVSTPVHNALDKSYAATERLIRLVEDLLNISRMEAGRLEYKFEKTDVQNLLQELYDNFLLAAKRKKLSLELKHAKDKIPPVEMDRDKVREVLSNIIDNAIKYTDKGGVTIKTEIIAPNAKILKEDNLPSTDKGKPLAGEALRITVTDTGIGIPESEMPYLFKKFSRGKDVARLNAGGTGLGIYVGKSMMEAHHGRIWVQSAGAGKGASFIVELPLSS